MMVFHRKRSRICCFAWNRKTLPENN